jgi:hypothetical protein
MYVFHAAVDGRVPAVVVLRRQAGDADGSAIEGQRETFVA